MASQGEVEVTLSEELIDHLYRLSYETDIPLRWLVAGIVCDTIEAVGGECASPARQSARRDPAHSVRSARKPSRALSRP